MSRLFFVFLAMAMALSAGAAAVVCSSAPLPKQQSGREVRVESVNEMQHAVRAAVPGNVILLAKKAVCDPGNAHG